MATTSAYGLPYPVGGDDTTIALYFQQLAQAVEDLLRGRFQYGGSGTVTINSGSNAATGTISFPVAFAMAPRVFVTPFNPGNATGATVTAQTASSFDWRAFTTSGSNVGSNTSAAFNWLAIAL